MTISDVVQTESKTTGVSCIVKHEWSLLYYVLCVYVTVCAYVCDSLLTTIVAPLTKDSKALVLCCSWSFCAWTQRYLCQRTLLLIIKIMVGQNRICQGRSCKPVVTLLLRSVTRTCCCAASWTLRLCVVSRHSRNHELDWTVLTPSSELVSSYPGNGFDLLYPTSGSFVFLCTMSSERPAYLDPRDEEDRRKSVTYNYFRLEFTGWCVAMQ